MTQATTIEEPKPSRDYARIFEDVGLFLIMFAVIAAALATSFTHMHDWTVRAFVAAAGLDPEGASPYGWSNAVISELVPLAGMLALRRRIVAGMSIVSYPLYLVVAGTMISVAAQLAWVSGAADGKVYAGALAVLPAVAAAALIKLVLSVLDSYAEERKRAERKARRKRAADARIADAFARLQAEAVAEADARRKAEEEAEEARSRERKVRAEAEAEEARRRKAEEEAGSLRAWAEAEADRLAGETGAEADARRDADRKAARLQAELDQIKAAEAKAREDANILRAQLEILQAQPVSAAPAPAKSRTPRHAAIELPEELPETIPGLSPAMTQAIADAYRANPGATQKEIALAVGTSDRTVRTFVNGINAQLTAA